MRSIEYHLQELAIALDQSNENCILPTILDTDQVILDIGCGIGQSLVALKCLDRTCIGVDVDEDAIRYGIAHYGNKIQYVLCDAVKISLPSDLCDLVFCRVSLPYTNLPAAIKEIRRVLRKNGRVWLTLHGKRYAHNFVREAFQSRNIKSIFHSVYVLMNGYLFKFFGLVVPYLNGRYESWQDTSAMRKMLAQLDFQVTIHTIGKHNVIEGRLI